jgi:hypothetical protein
MNPLNLFILSSQLALSVFVAANPTVQKKDNRPPETQCKKGHLYINKSFNLYTTQTDGSQLMIALTGQVQVGVDSGSPVIARFDKKREGGYP